MANEPTPTEYAHILLDDSKTETEIRALIAISDPDNHFFIASDTGDLWMINNSGEKINFGKGTLDNVVSNGNQLLRTMDISNGHITGQKSAALQPDLVPFSRLQQYAPPKIVEDVVSSVPTAEWPGETHLMSSGASSNPDSIAELMLVDTPLDTVAAHQNFTTSAIRKIINCPEINTQIFLSLGTTDCYRSRDGGRNIETIAMGTSGTRGLGAYSARRDIICTVRNASNIDYSLDGGYTWGVSTFDTALSGDIRGLCVGGVNEDIFMITVVNGSGTDIYTNGPSDGTQFKLVANIPAASNPTDPIWFPDVEGFCFTATGTTANKSNATGTSWTAGTGTALCQSLEYCPWLKAIIGPYQGTIRISYDGLTYTTHTITGLAATGSWVAVDKVNQRIAVAAGTTGTSSIAVSKTGAIDDWEILTTDSIEPESVAFIDGRLWIGTNTSGSYIMLSDIDVAWRYHQMQEGQVVYDQARYSKKTLQSNIVNETVDFQLHGETTTSSATSDDTILRLNNPDDTTPIYYQIADLDSDSQNDWLFVNVEVWAMRDNVPGPSPTSSEDGAVGYWSKRVLLSETVPGPTTLTEIDEQISNGTGISFTDPTIEIDSSGNVHVTTEHTQSDTETTTIKWGCRVVGSRRFGDWYHYTPA